MHWCEQKIGQEKLFLVSNSLHRDGAIKWDALLKWNGGMGGNCGRGGSKIFQGWRGGANCTLRWQNQWGMPPPPSPTKESVATGENWNLIVYCYTREILAMPWSRKTALLSARKKIVIINKLHWGTSSKGSRWLAVQWTLSPPLPNLPLLTNGMITCWDNFTPNELSTSQKEIITIHHGYKMGSIQHYLVHNATFFTGDTCGWVLNNMNTSKFT